MDEIDIQIISALSDDGRLSSAELARRLGISERVARYRMDKLMEGGKLRIRAIATPKEFGFVVSADIFVEAEPARVLDIAREIASHEQVTYVACSTGANDISVQLVARSNGELYEIVTGFIARIPGVRKTTTSIVPLIVKDVYEWRVPHSIGK